MRSLLYLSGLIDKLSTAVGRALSWVILIVVFISAGNAVSRKVFDLSSNAWLEIQWYLFGAIFLLAAGYTLLNNEHVRVDVLLSAFSERIQVKVEIFGVLFFLLPVCAVVFWLAVPMFYDSFVMHEMSSNAGGLVRWPVKLLVPLGFGLLTLAALSHLIKCAGFLAGLCPNPTRIFKERTAEERLADEIAEQALDIEENARGGR